MSQTVVSVVLPIRNEEKYIEKCILSLLEQDYPLEKTEIIFADGMSEDGTRAIIEKYIAENKVSIRICDNPNRTVPYAMNIGIKAAKGKYIVRMDAHSEYANDYISKCVWYLENTDADNVGGPMIAKGKTFFQKVVAASYYSPFALGGGKFHDDKYEGYADTVYLGAYKKQTLIDVGLYDEKFVRNQDDELNLRIINGGGKIFITPNIKSVYYPRGSVGKLFSQYFQYGDWKVEVIRKHKKPARLSHLVPLLFVLYIILGAVLSAAALALGFPFVFYAFAAVFALYLLLCIVFALKSNAKGITEKAVLCFVFFILHFSYGLGFLKGIFVKKGSK